MPGGDICTLIHNHSDAEIGSVWTTGAQNSNFGCWKMLKHSGPAFC